MAVTQGQSQAKAGRRQLLAGLPIVAMALAACGSSSSHNASASTASISPATTPTTLAATTEAAPPSTTPPSPPAPSEVVVGCGQSTSNPSQNDLYGYDATTGAVVFTRPMYGQSSSLQQGVPCGNLQNDGFAGPYGFTPDFKQYITTGPDQSNSTVPIAITLLDGQEDTATDLGQTTTGNSFDVTPHDAVSVGQNSNGDVYWLDAVHSTTTSDYSYVLYQDSLSDGSTTDVNLDWNLHLFDSTNGAQAAEPNKIVFGTGPDEVAITYQAADGSTRYVTKDGVGTAKPPFTLATYPSYVQPSTIDQILNDPNANNYGGWYSTDHQTVFFTAADRNNNLSLCSVPANGGSPTTLVNSLPPDLDLIGVTTATP